MEKGLREQKDLSNIDSYVEDTGEVDWLVLDAINKEIPIPVIFQSIMELFKSRTKDSDTYKAIALMRHGFGGHPFGKDDSIVQERKTSRIQTSRGIRWYYRLFDIDSCKGHQTNSNML